MRDFYPTSHFKKQILVKHTFVLSFFYLIMQNTFQQECCVFLFQIIENFNTIMNFNQYIFPLKFDNPYKIHLKKKIYDEF